MALFKGWRTGLASMRNAKLRQTWKQRVRRLGRRKKEIIWRIGETADEMVVVSDRHHDLDDVPLAGTRVPIRWWHGADGWQRREAVKGDKSLIYRRALEINATTAVRFLLDQIGRSVSLERADHRGKGRCKLESGTAKIVHSSWSVRMREEVYQRIELELNYDQGAPLVREISYAEFLELDNSSFWAGWKRWFEEWVLFARVSIFGDR